MTINLDHVTEQITVTDSASDASLTVNPKGTGAFNVAAGSSGVNISNGGTVTGITRTAFGSGYTSIPSVAITAPTTTGGVTATGYVNVSTNIVPTITSGGTGYAVNDVLTVSGGVGTAVQLTVSSVSAGVITGVTISNVGYYATLPTYPAAVTGGTGTGATFTFTTWYFGGVSITNAGSGYVEQPTVSFSGGGGSGAAAYARIGSEPVLRSIGQQLTVATASGTQLQIGETFGATLANSNFIISGRTSGPPVMGVSSTDANAGAVFYTKGTGAFQFFTQATNSEQLRIANTSSAVNYIQVTGAATGNAAGPLISAQGSDASIPLSLQSKLNSPINFYTSGGYQQFKINNIATAVNYLQTQGSATGLGLQFSAQGSDTNISQVFQSKGTGAIDLAAGSSGVNISNGGTVTAITRTSAGNATYTSIPSVVISAPTTSGGVQATATVSMGAAAATIGSGGTGYTVGDVLTIVGGTLATGFATGATFTVSSVSAGVVTAVTATNFNQYTVLPTNPVSTTGGTGTGCTLNVLYALGSVWNITNAGSGYVEQPTVSFSGGGGSGAAAYATVGSGTTVKSIGSTMSFSTPGGEALRITDNGSATSYFNIFAGGATNIFESTGSPTNVSAQYRTKGTGTHDFNTGGTFANTQFRVAHTASAVNYVQVTGGATGGGPTISAQGSDSNITLGLQSKGVAAVALLANTKVQFDVYGGSSSVNYIRASGSAAGFAPSFQSLGSDTNIDLALTPKGTGALVAQASDGGTTINARGANAVDLQTSRGSANQVASGSYSVVSGGGSNRASGSYSTAVGGNSNTATGFGSFGGGGNTNTVSSSYGFLGAGQLNTVSGFPSAVVGGTSNTAAGFHNFIGAGFTNSGTSGSAVTTQSGTMNGTTAVTLSGSNASIKVGQYITGTSIADDTYVAAISGTSLTLSKNASGSSTSTLSFYTPHGVVVGGGNNQATGAYSFIGGGGDAGTAANRNVASGAWSTVVGGRNNTASGDASFIGGGGLHPSFGSFPNTTSATGSAVVCGFSNTSSNQGAFIGGGYANSANGVYSAIMGGVAGTARSIAGLSVFPSHNAPIASSSGVTQSALLVLGVQTTDATATVLRSDTNAAGTTNQVILPNNSAYYFRGEVVSGVTGGGNTKGWYIEGVIKRGANAASTALVGTPTVTSNYADAGASTWTLTATADTTNGGLALTFTGQAGTTIRTVACINTTEMTY